jgi:hypothetical protein
MAQSELLVLTTVRLCFVQTSTRNHKGFYRDKRKVVPLLTTNKENEDE